jgi:hypothetical protein
MKRALELALAACAAAYVGAAVVGLVRERRGLIACGCAPDCWCHRPGLRLFRWVFPRGHKSARA